MKIPFRRRRRLRRLPTRPALDMDPGLSPILTRRGWGRDFLLFESDSSPISPHFLGFSIGRLILLSPWTAKHGDRTAAASLCSTESYGDTLGVRQTSPEDVDIRRCAV